LNMYLVSANEMRAMDNATIETFGLPGRVLMENAGRGATAVFLEKIYRHHPQNRVAVVAGGDGFVMARYLAQKKIPVSVYLFSSAARVGGDAAANLSLLSALGVMVKEVPDSDTFNALKPELWHQQIWIDAILGTGLSSDVRGFYKEVIDFINASNRPIFSVDIPSGLNSDTGQPCGTCIKATATATFAFAKIGHLLYPGASFTGDLSIVEIGIPYHIASGVNSKQHLITPDDIHKYIAPRQAEAHKGTNGHLLVVAGSTGKTGAAAMTAMSAVRSGAGLVTLAVATGLNAILENQILEAMTVPLPEVSSGTLGVSAKESILDLCRGKQCLAIGPGLGNLPETKELVLNLIQKSPVPMVIDADGLNSLADNPDVLKATNVPIVLTPHPGEMARLLSTSTSDVNKEKISHARHFAQTYGVYLVLKGARSLIALPNGHVYINPTGNPGMATGGMGDVLTGIIAGFITQGYKPEVAACMGTYLHGAAADSLAKKGQPMGFIASQVMDYIPYELGKYLDASSFTLPVQDPLGYST
jgi:hydroxyethylthiazole kinase-like uncharacterized protein yjeF